MKHYKRDFTITSEQEASMERLLKRLQQDPQFELKQELGKFLMRHINDLSEAELERYNEIKRLLKS